MYGHHPTTMPTTRTVPPARTGSAPRIARPRRLAASRSDGAGAGAMERAPFCFSFVDVAYTENHKLV
jgi:hypothetical protein